MLVRVWQFRADKEVQRTTPAAAAPRTNGLRLRTGSILGPSEGFRVVAAESVVRSSGEFARLPAGQSTYTHHVDTAELREGPVTAEPESDLTAVALHHGRAMEELKNGKPLIEVYGRQELPSVLTSRPGGPGGRDCASLRCWSSLSLSSCCAVNEFHEGNSGCTGASGRRTT